MATKHDNYKSELDNISKQKAEIEGKLKHRE